LKKKIKIIKEKNKKLYILYLFYYIYNLPLFTPMDVVPIEAEPIVEL